MRNERVSAIAAGICLVILAGCHAETDRERYAVGDEGTASLINDSPLTVYLGGCSLYAFEKLEGGRWVDRGSPWLCIWAGFALPVAPGSSRDDPLMAPGEPGTWRLRYRTGLGCSASEPLSEASCELGDPESGRCGWEIASCPTRSQLPSASLSADD
jgi:hypothetical protein